MKFFMHNHVEVEELPDAHTLIKIRVHNSLALDLIELLDNLFHAARWIKIRTKRPFPASIFPERGLRVP